MKQKKAKKSKSKSEIIKQIRKLMIHERSARQIGSIGEADSFAAKISALRAKHEVTQEIVIDDSPDYDFDGEPVFMPDSEMFRRKSIFWESTLFVAVCLYFDCRPLSHSSSNLKFVVGEKENRKKAIKSYLHLYKEARRESDEYLSRMAASNEALETNTQIARRSFFLGFAFHIAQRLSGFKYNEAQLKKLRKYFPNENSISANPDGLMKSEKIITTEQLKKRESIEQDLSKLKKPPEPKIEVLDSDAYIAGIDAAELSSMTDEILIPAKAVFEEAVELSNRRQAQYDEMQERAWGMGADAGTPSGSTTVYRTYLKTTYAGVQGNFDFSE